MGEAKKRGRRGYRTIVWGAFALCLLTAGIFLGNSVSLHYVPEQNRALLKAACNGDIAAATTALDAGADPDAREPLGFPLVQQASWRLRALLWFRPTEAAYARREMTFTPDSALILAVRQDDTEMVRVLLAHGAKPDVRAGYGQTALAVSAFLAQQNASAQEEIARQLLHAGADPNTHSTDGQTPLHAALFGHASLHFVQQLLEAGADVHAPGKDGLRPLDVISHHTDPAVARFLLLQINRK